ncbi:MAG: hypothetical protein WCL44_07555, partial [bacterium]
RVVQDLLIDNPGRVDWEEALEVLCELVLSGGIAASRKTAAGGRLQPVERLPAWLAVGLSHHIDPALKARDRRIFLNCHKTGRVPAIADILKKFSLPSGRSTEKAVCTMAVAWLLGLPDSAGRWERIRDRLAAGETISCDWLLKEVPGCTTVEDLERKWQGRPEDERFVISDPGLLFPDALDAVKEQLVIRQGEYGVPADTNMPAVLALKDLIAMKRQEWIQPFCRAKAVGIGIAAVGGSSEVRDVASAYCGFLELLGGAESDSSLNSSLVAADAKLNKLATLVREREDYVDGVERRLAGTNVTVSAVPNESIDSLDRTPLQKYIDAVEQRLGVQHGEAAGAVPASEGANVR